MQLMMMAFIEKGGIAITMAFMSENGSFEIETMRMRVVVWRNVYFAKDFLFIFKIQSWEM